MRQCIAGIPYSYPEEIVYSAKVPFFDLVNSLQDNLKKAQE